MSIKTQPQPFFIVDLESERSASWPDGSRVHCKDTGKNYILDTGAWVLMGPGAGGSTKESHVPFLTLAVEVAF